MSATPSEVGFFGRDLRLQSDLAQRPPGSARGRIFGLDKRVTNSPTSNRSAATSFIRGAAFNASSARDRRKLFNERRIQASNGAGSGAS